MLTLYPLLAYVLIVGIVGDVACKYATTSTGNLVWVLIGITGLCWGTNAYAWYHIYRLKSITEMIVLFNMSQIIAMAIIAVVWFNEPIHLKLVIAFILTGICFWLLS